MYLEIFLADFAVFHVFWGISRDFAEIPEFRGSATTRNIRSPDLSSYKCVVFFWSWISWFLDLFWLYNYWLDCGIRGSASAAIGRRWKTSRQIYKKILALKELPQSIFLFRRRLQSSNCSFIVYCKQSLPTPFCEFWHVTAANRHTHVKIRPIVRIIRNL